MEKQKITEKIGKEQIFDAESYKQSPSSEIEIDFLGGDKMANFTNQMMHAMDMFESGKQLATPDRFIVKGNPDLPKLCEKIATAYEQAGGYAVFVGIRKINGKRVGNPYAWFMGGVQSIFIDQKNKRCILFKDILAQLDYNAKTDEYMRVVSVETMPSLKEQMQEDKSKREINQLKTP